MPKAKENIKVIITPAKTFKIKEGCKYLMIMPANSDLTRIGPAIETFFGDKKVLVIAVNDVSAIKIAEIVEEMDNG